MFFVFHEIENASTLGAMLRPSDIFVALALCDRERGGPDGWTYPRVSDDLGLALSVIHGSVKRLGRARLWIAGAEVIDRQRLARFLVFGLPAMLPATLGEDTRGVPTAWAAEPLASLFSRESDLPPVWPDPRGLVRGRAVAPLHPSAPYAAANSPELGRRLALVDALRLGGGARIEQRAATLLAAELRVLDGFTHEMLATSS